MRVVGLTGGMGSGKTTVLKILEFQFLLQMTKLRF